MRKLTVFAAVTAALLCFLCGCSKHNNGGNSYYVSFQSGAIFYTRPVDSSVQNRITVGGAYGLMDMESYRTTQQTDSATAGLITLATWSISLGNYTAPYNTFTGNYTTDTSAANHKMLIDDTRFRFYSGTDPHRGQYVVNPGLPFTVTVTQWTASWFEGTFEGMAVGTNSVTHVLDTVTITNGKFKMPFN
jgi:hypothetical protein